MAASEGPLASLTSDICLDYIETKTDPDIDIGIFYHHHVGNSPYLWI